MNHQDGRTVTLGIVDNDQLTLAALTAILRDLPWLRVLWSTTSGDDAVDRCLDSGTRPLVMLVDMSMENTSGAAVCRSIRRHSLTVGLICMTSFSLASYARVAAEAGAQALVSKTDLHGLSTAIRRAAIGMATPCIDDETAHFTAVPGMDSGSIDNLPHVPEPRQWKEEQLSSREIEIMRMYSEGLETEEIAQSLSLSRFTIGTYVKRAVAKLRARNRIHAIIMCEKQGLL